MQQAFLQGRPPGVTLKTWRDESGWGASIDIAANQWWDDTTISVQGCKTRYRAIRTLQHDIDRRADRLWHGFLGLLEAFVISAGYGWDRYETALNRQIAREAGQLSEAAEYLPPTTPEEVRRLFAEEGGSDALFEMAGLTPREREVWERKAQGDSDREIAQNLQSKRSKRLEQMGGGVSVETVYGHLSRGRAKMQALIENREAAAAS